MGSPHEEREWERVRQHRREQGLIPVVMPEWMFDRVADEIFDGFWDDRADGLSVSKYSSHGCDWHRVAKELGVRSVVSIDPAGAPHPDGHEWHDILAEDEHWTPTLWCKPHPIATAENHPQ